MLAEATHVRQGRAYMMTLKAHMLVEISCI